MKKLVILLIFISTLIYGQIWKPPAAVREIPVPALSDIAIASFDNFGPVIYFNPTLCNQAGPYFSMFTRVHEYGHIYLNHIQKSMFVTNPYAKIHLSQVNELEADCFAVSQLCKISPQSIATAKNYFQAKGTASGDAFHPAGIIRAANIEQCYQNCNGGDDPVPVSISIEIPDIRVGELGGIIEIYIDKNSIGKISNFNEDFETSIDLDEILSGEHTYKLKVKIYTFQGYEPYFSHTIYGTGTITIEDEGDTFVVADGAVSPKLIKK